MSPDSLLTLSLYNQMWLELSIKVQHPGTLDPQLFTVKRKCPCERKQVDQRTTPAPLSPYFEPLPSTGCPCWSSFWGSGQALEECPVLRRPPYARKSGVSVSGQRQPEGS